MSPQLFMLILAPFALGPTSEEVTPAPLRTEQAALDETSSDVTEASAPASLPASAPAWRDGTVHRAPAGPSRRGWLLPGSRPWRVIEGRALAAGSRNGRSGHGAQLGPHRTRRDLLWRRRILGDLASVHLRR